MTRTRLLFALLLAACGTTSGGLAFAQPIRVEHSRRDCNLSEVKSDGGIKMPRYDFHLMNRSIAFAVADGTASVTHASRATSAVVAFVAVGLASHALNGIVLRRIAINPMDWAFDALNAAAPLLYAVGADGRTWQSETLAFTTDAALYATFACWSSP